MICDYCHGTGYVIATRADGREGARPCTCLEQVRAIRGKDEEYKRSAPGRLAGCLIPREYQHCQFSDYKPESESQIAAHAAAQKFAIEWKRDGGGILFYGREKGRGKTHLAVACLKRLVEKHGATGLFVDFLALCKSLSYSYGDEDLTQEAEIFRRLLSVDVLLVDDVGTEKRTDFKEETLYHLVNQRYSEKKSLIVTTNMLFEDDLTGAPSIERYFSDGRVYSRLCAICPPGRRVAIRDGRDWRKG